MSWAQGTETWPKVGLMSGIALEVPSEDICTWEGSISSRYLSGALQLANPRCPRSWWRRASRLQGTTSHIKSDIQQAKKEGERLKIHTPLISSTSNVTLPSQIAQWQNPMLGQSVSIFAPRCHIFSGRTLLKLNVFPAEACEVSLSHKLPPRSRSKSQKLQPWTKPGQRSWMNLHHLAETILMSTAWEKQG